MGTPVGFLWWAPLHFPRTRLLGMVASKVPAAPLWCDAYLCLPQPSGLGWYCVLHRMRVAPCLPSLVDWHHPGALTSLEGWARALPITFKKVTLGPVR